jgi:thiamine biosynthesis lipoprotein
VRADGADERVLRGVRSLVETEEQRFSRFRRGSALSQLNRTGSMTDRRLAEVVRLARRIGRATGGAFDPMVGSAVVAAGYDRSFDDLRRGGCRVEAWKSAGQLRCARHTVHVAGGAIDLGGVAKGWTVDRVGDYLRSRGCPRFVVDAGGDILVAASGTEGELIGLNDSGWSVRLQLGAVATSSTLRRSWVTAQGRRHHIIDPASQTSAVRRFVAASVVAPTTAVADALGTALLANPELAMPALARFEAEAFLIDASGASLMTPGMERWLA